MAAPAPHHDPRAPGTDASAGALVVRRGTVEDAAALLEFTLRNRAFLAPWEPRRHPDRYRLAAMREQLAGPPSSRVQYLALDATGRVVGQAALSNVVLAEAFLNATLGYAVDEHCQGRGIATRMVRHVVRDAFTTIGLHRVEAGTLRHNVASQRVLERCGFTRIGLSPRHLRIDGRWQDHELYSITADHQGRAATNSTARRMA